MLLLVRRKFVYFNPNFVLACYLRLFSHKFLNLSKFENRMLPKTENIIFKNCMVAHRNCMYANFNISGFPSLVILLAHDSNFLDLITSQLFYFQVICLKSLTVFGAFLKHELISKDEIFRESIPHFLTALGPKLFKVCVKQRAFIPCFAITVRSYFREMFLIRSMYLFKAYFD